MYENEMIIAVKDGEGKIIAEQSYHEFLSGKKNIEILNYYTGQKLFDILYDDLDMIKYEDNKFMIKVMLELNPMRTVMKILGKIAEAVIVRRCNEDEELNKKWLSIARGKKAKWKTVDKFRAVGTGLKSTQQLYPSIYNPFDTQRDIVWVDEEGMMAIIKKSSVAGMNAGLQVKVSRDGMGYFFRDLCNMRYEIPVVYFDICNDYDNVMRELRINQMQFSCPNPSIPLEEKFVKASAIDYEGYREVCYYEDLVMALVQNKITPDGLLNHGITMKSKTLQNALITASLSELPINNITY
ncbi:MAG: hypothetical protein PHY47_18405 [Lachnospiraceae bacterium]|nr:hypothetical protein [Lachnospiraceae bacterium]